MSTVQVTVPPTFYDDHVARDLPAGVEVKRTSRGVVVDLTPDELAELRSDAVHYSNAVRDMGSDFIGLQSSARATVRALDKQGATP
jgi:hypothetical protein